MRIGDLDALAKEFKRMRDCNPNDNHFMGYACHFLNSGQEPSTEWECIDNALENAPTIDAIPMDWMDAQIRGYASRLQSTELKALVLVKQMWVREQEAR